MPTHQQIADDWKVSRTVVSESVHKGCPTTSLEAARAWKALHKSRSPIKEEEVGTLPTRTVKRRELTGDSLTDAYYRAIDAYEEIHEMLVEAMEAGNVARIAAFLGLHNRALKSQLEFEKAFREEQERRKILIPLSDAKAAAMTTFGAIIRRLDAMPQKLATQINRDNPMLALDILTRESRDIKLEAAKSLAF